MFRDGLRNQFYQKPENVLYQLFCCHWNNVFFLSVMAQVSDLNM